MVKKTGYNASTEEERIIYDVFHALNGVNRNGYRVKGDRYAIRTGETPDGKDTTIHYMSIVQKGSVMLFGIIPISRDLYTIFAVDTLVERTFNLSQRSNGGSNPNKSSPNQRFYYVDQDLDRSIPLSIVERLHSMGLKRSNNSRWYE